jgi:ribosome modulation factor
MISERKLNRLIGEGRNARRLGLSKSACPYPINDTGRRCAWLAGWNEVDMESTPFTCIDYARAEAEFLVGETKQTHVIVDMRDHLAVIPAKSTDYAKASILEVVDAN